MIITPRYYTIVSGIGKGQYELTAFDHALHVAGIGDYNLVKISSILPAECCYVNAIDLPKGSIVYTAYAHKILNPKSEIIGSVAVGIAVAKNNSENGVIFEASVETNEAEKIVRKMCCEAMLNRTRAIKDLVSKAEQISADQQLYVCGVAAVAMW